MTTRRSTRRTAASAEPAQPGMESRARASPPAEPPKKRAGGRKGKAPAAQPEPESQSVPEATTTSRAASSSTTTTSASAVPRRATRAALAAGEASPLRAPTDADLKLRADKKRKRTDDQGAPIRRRARLTPASPTPDAEPAKPASAPGDDNTEEQGLFFSHSKPQSSSESEIDVLRNKISQLEARVVELEAENFQLERRRIALAYANEDLRRALNPSPPVDDPRHPDFPPEVPVSPLPVKITGSESALALFRKIEAAAKDPPSVDTEEDGETSEGEVVAMEASPSSSVKGPAAQSITPPRPIASPSGFFSRSFSAIKSKLGFSTSTPQAPPSAPRPLPPPNTFTEALSIPPTPVGERVQTPPKTKKRTDPMRRALLKGIEHKDKAKAEAWAKQIIPQLKNERDFREKRKRLETPVLMKDLNHFPAAKPWESGFGDPLADLDDDDVVPVWAVYLDMMAEQEEPKAKKHKNTHEVTMDDDYALSMNEQHAASSSPSSSRNLSDSHRQSASLLNLHPRRSIDPSPMFDTPVSHQRDGNVFCELQGHDTATQIRASHRESLLRASPPIRYAHNPEAGSFSVPEDSDDDDTTMTSDTSDADAALPWTQPPPPAPVPAHAPLPGGSTTQEPVDEVQRQRQKLMKHTPAKPSRLREATYPSPSLRSDAGNESIMAATPAPAMFDDIPGAEPLDIDEDALAAAKAIQASDAWKQQLAANPWPPAIIRYESEEEDLSPV